VVKDRRDSAALQERHYTRLLTEGCSSHPPAKTSTPFGVPSLGDDLSPDDGASEFFGHVNMLRQRLTCLLAGIENKSALPRHNPAAEAQVFVVYHAFQKARMSQHAWQDMHSGDRELLERAERVLQRTGARFTIRTGLK